MIQLTYTSHDRDNLHVGDNVHDGDNLILKLTYTSHDRDNLSVGDNAHDGRLYTCISSPLKYKGIYEKNT